MNKIISIENQNFLKKIRLSKKEIFLVDESYNSNPLSLKSALENYDKIDSKNSKKYLILGDMLELGKNSISQHKAMSKISERLVKLANKVGKLQ